MISLKNLLLTCDEKLYLPYVLISKTFILSLILNLTPELSSNAPSWPGLVRMAIEAQCRAAAFRDTSSDTRTLDIL